MDLRLRWRTLRSPWRESEGPVHAAFSPPVVHRNRRRTSRLGCPLHISSSAYSPAFGYFINPLSNTVAPLEVGGGKRPKVAGELIRKPRYEGSRQSALYGGVMRYATSPGLRPHY
jgi:hypothetical protein